MIGDVRIERATPDDLNPVLALLALHDLPPDALEEHLATMLVARRGGDVVGSAALEVYADGTLLRSVAVAPDVQGQGVGRMLTKAALSLAEANRTPNEACCEPPQIPSIRAQLLATVAASESAWVQPAVHPRSRRYPLMPRAASPTRSRRAFGGPVAMSTMRARHRAAPAGRESLVRIARCRV